MSIFDGLFAPATCINYLPGIADPAPAPEPELPDSLADEAMSLVGFHDAMRAQNLEELRQFRERLAHNIERETEALAEVDAMIARDEHAISGPVPKPISKRKGREAMA